MKVERLIIFLIGGAIFNLIPFCWGDAIPVSLCFVGGITLMICSILIKENKDSKNGT